MSGHDHHDHGHGGHCHGEHDHSNDITPAIQSLLYSQIDFDSISTLNGESPYRVPHGFAPGLILIVNRGRTRGWSCNRPEDLGGTTE